MLLAGCSGLRRLRLLGRGCWSRCRGGAAWTTCSAHCAFVTELLLTLEIFVEAHGQVLDDHVLHAEAALEFSDELVVRGANLLIHVDALAMLVDTIGELARAPVLGLFNFAALFR